MRLPLRRVHRGDEERPAVPVPDGVKHREGKGELLRHLLAPLAGQRGRREDQGAPNEAPDHVFLEDEPGLDGLAETNFIREDPPAVHLAQDAEHRTLLMLVSGDASERRPSQQPVEPVHQGDAVRFAVQSPREGSIARRPKCTGEKIPVRVVKPEGEGGIRRRRGLPRREGHEGGSLHLPPQASRNRPSRY